MIKNTFKWDEQGGHRSTHAAITSATLIEGTERKIYLIGLSPNEEPNANRAAWACFKYKQEPVLRLRNQLAIQPQSHHWNWPECVAVELVCLWQTRMMVVQQAPEQPTGIQLNQCVALNISQPNSA